MSPLLSLPSIPIGSAQEQSAMRGQLPKTNLVQIRITDPKCGANCQLTTNMWSKLELAQNKVTHILFAI